MARGRKPIEINTDYTVSRQRRWQRRKAKEGKCIVCGRESDGLRCDYHYYQQCEINKNYRQNRKYKVKEKNKQIKGEGEKFMEEVRNRNIFSNNMGDK